MNIYTGLQRLVMMLACNSVSYYIECHKEKNYRIRGMIYGQKANTKSLDLPIEQYK